MPSVSMASIVIGNSVKNAVRMLGGHRDRPGVHPVAEHGADTEWHGPTQCSGAATSAVLGHDRTPPSSR